jgi:hypothetical protein
MIARAFPAPVLACVAVLLAGPALAQSGRTQAGQARSDDVRSDRAQSGSAQPDADGSLGALIDGGRANLGKRTRLTKLRCADTGGAGYVCKTVYKGRVVAVGAKRTGARTSPDAARRFSTECEGLTGFNNPACTFDVEVTPSGTARGSVNAGGSKRPLVTIDADSFDLF